MDKIRVLVADDHTLFRDGLRALLSSTTDMELAGEAATGDEAIELAASLQPDLILMDIQMPGVNGAGESRSSPVWSSSHSRACCPKTTCGRRLTSSGWAIYRSAALDEIASHGHVLTPGRYVGAEEVEDNTEMLTSVIFS